MGRSLVEVASIDDLAKIAERNSRMILHQAHDGQHRVFRSGGGHHLLLQIGERYSADRNSGQSCPGWRRRPVMYRIVLRFAILGLGVLIVISAASAMAAANHVPVNSG